jgi:Xaa-Pro aminopeptidase
VNYPARLQGLQKDFSELGFDVLLISHLANMRYLCGFTGSSGVLLVSPEACLFFTDGRYREQSRDEVKGAKVVIGQRSALASAAEWFAKRRKSSNSRGWKLGIEGEHFTVADRRRLISLLPKYVHVREAPPLTEKARMIKDAEEISLMRKAARMGAGLLDHALASIRAGATEIKAAARMEFAARKAGADSMSFETIIASGVRSALPHGRASKLPISAGGFVVCDFGVILHGYCSDRTRTVYVGSATKEARRTYGAVLEAQLAAIDAVRPGASVSSVDKTARKVLQKNGLAKYFTHSTGHGVGLEIHEAPRVAKGQPELLYPGMVITVEPGAYLPGKWGVRIEDMVVVTEHGCEVLEPTQKEFIVI